MKTIGKCKDCKYWDKRDNHWGFCDHPKVKSANWKRDDLNPSEVVSPGPMFGCIHWEAKIKK
jgi:hypothetical protein